MTLTELRYIVALAQEQHFGRAAERCHVSQPTLSIAVKKLEEELSAVLFERGKQGVQATPLGERIVAMAGLMLDQAAAIKDVADSDKDQLQGPLALGTLPTIGPYLLPQFIPLLQQTAPQLSLYIEEGNETSLTLKLRNGELDAILVTEPFTEPDVVTQSLFDEPFVLLLPADHKLAGKTLIAAADLDPAEMLLLGEGDCFREQVLAAFPHLNPKSQPAPGEAQFHPGKHARYPASHGGLEVGDYHPASIRGRRLFICTPSVGDPAVCEPGAHAQLGAVLARELSTT